MLANSAGSQLPLGNVCVTVADGGWEVRPAKWVL